MQWTKVVEALNNVIIQVRKDYVIDNKIIRDDVFGILEKYCTVLYYPIPNERNRGFHIKKIVNDKLEDFVYINTAHPLEEQVFTAAHELGHIWNVAEQVWKEIGETEPLPRELEENITSRFAAELLMPTEAFRTTFFEKIKEIGVNGPMIKEDELIRVMVIQMSDFLTPYESVRKRLYETNIIGEATRRYLKEHRDSILPKVDIYSKEENSRLGKSSMNIAIPGIRGLIEDAEVNGKLDDYTLKKIKADFAIQDVKADDKVLEIHLGECQDGENGSIG